MWGDSESMAYNIHTCFLFNIISDTMCKVPQRVLLTEWSSFSSIKGFSCYRWFFSTNQKLLKYTLLTIARIFISNLVMKKSLRPHNFMCCFVLSSGFVDLRSNKRLFFILALTYFDHDVCTFYSCHCLISLHTSLCI